MFPRTTLFLSTRGEPHLCEALRGANDDLDPDRPATVAFAALPQQALQIAPTARA